MHDDALYIIKGIDDLQEDLLQVLIDQLGCAHEHYVTRHFTDDLVILQVMQNGGIGIIFRITAAHLLKLLFQPQHLFLGIAEAGELCRRLQSKDRRAQAGLDIDVFDHHTGRLRDVKTLSGGESFLGALSLALGLSDVIQRCAGGVAVETVFIDEGFGSLDSNALEQVLRVLMTLSEGQRQIGIISHVAELQERIDRQIVVHRERIGSSAEIIKA